VRYKIASGGFGVINEGLLISKNQKAAIKHYSNETNPQNIQKELFNRENIDKNCLDAFVFMRGYQLTMLVIL
jgi:hypothetical protein